ncbi:MAG: hypothetical protein JEZ10_05245 [Verrucomicrobia bacterium]|nr:hypothetical protein [Verrucomicrobiota bacterium]
MQKKTTIIAITSLIAILFSPATSACMLKISTEMEQPQVGDIDVITVQFIQIHRNCTVKPEATEFETEGLKILDSTAWAPIRDNVYERTFHVEYSKSGTASFQIKRICPKKGEQLKSLDIAVQ